MELVERQNYLDELLKLSKEVSSGTGKTVIVSGESGIGKTSLIKHFTNTLEPDAEILWGGCDDLFTPRPLGPLYDIAFQLKSDLIKKLEREDNRVSIFSEFLNYLQKRPGLKIIVVEDIHWADEATLDFIKYLSRRISRTKTVLILSYRDDEVSRDNYLRSVFGDLPHEDIKRIRLYPLSESAVNALLHKAGLNESNLYRMTGGNPFYVTEVLASKNQGLPSSIKDAIIARTAGLDSGTRRVLEIISVIPNKVEIEFLKKLADGIEEKVEICIKKAVLTSESDLISFRHELGRLAFLDTIPEIHKLRLHQQVLQCLLQNPDQNKYLARIVHHAVNSNDADNVIKYAPLAARQASALGAHTLAAEHYLYALRYSDKISARDKIELYEGRSYECYLTGKIEEGIAAGEAALEILKKYPDPKREGEIYRKLSRMMWYNCDDEKGEEYLDKAINVFKNLPPGRDLAMAYSNKSQTYAIREENDTAFKWGQKALTLARKINDPEIEAHALNNIGCSYMQAGDKAGENELKKSLEISLKYDLFEHVVRAYINLGSINLGYKNLAEADKYFTSGIEYCNEKDLYIFSLCQAGHHSKVKLLYGEWDKAVELANLVLTKENVPPGNRLLPQTIVALIRARRNDPGAWQLLEKTFELAVRMGENEKIVSSAASRAEYFWLQNKLTFSVDELELVYNKVIKSDNPWTVGEIAFWLWKAGCDIDVTENIAEPYLLQIKGRWKEASELWRKLHCPYEEALALSDGDEKAKKKSIEIFNRLGAVAASRLIKQKMRESGIKSIPRGARKTTKDNPSGLTERQMEVLNLVSKGLSNNEIGDKLYISPKTVDHHISAILGKLNLHSRTEAASFARSNGIILNQ